MATNRKTKVRVAPGAEADDRWRARLEGEIGEAIKSGQVVPYYQPLVDLQTGAVIGCEVLARWKHPTHGLLLPWMFIPIAKGTGHISSLTYALLRRATKDAQTWPEPLSMSLNLSPLMVTDNWLAAEILKILRDCAFPAHRLEMEITETTLIDRPQEARVVLESLRNLGVRIALDDFGTGYSGLSYLRQFQIDRIKLDRSFVQAGLADSHDQELVGSIISFCHSLALSVTAEGIESVDTLNRLTALGCDVGQGYLFSKPKPNRGFLRYLQRSSARRARRSEQTGSGLITDLQYSESDAGSRIAGLDALNLLPTQIALLDHRGEIIFTNRTWKESAAGRLAKRRWNYLDECAAAADRGCADGRIIGEAIGKILRRELSEFVATYSCPFDRSHHWFQVAILSPRASDKEIGAIIMHSDVTALQHDYLPRFALGQNRLKADLVEPIRTRRASRNLD